MFKFDKEQKVVEVGNVTMGGQPGELPTALIGSIFYSGQKMVSDAKKGIFDEERAESIINTMEELSDQTNIPFILDIVGDTEEAFKNYINFLADITDAPLQIDVFNPKVRMAIISLMSEVGLQDRAINNSIYKGVRDEELENLKNSGVKASILLCSMLPTKEGVEERLNNLEELLPMAEKAGLEAPLIDTSCPPWGVNVGVGPKTMYLVKEKFGDKGVVGTGIANVTDTLGWVTGNFPKKVARACDASQNAMLPILGADWIMFGPVEIAEYIFPAVAVIDTYVLTATAELGVQPAIEGYHPLFKTIT